MRATGNTARPSAAPKTTGKGAVWVFTRSGRTWTQQGPKLVGTGAAGPASQGDSVALSADRNTALVGGEAENPHGYDRVGAVWVFTRSGRRWTQEGAKLVGAVGAAGQGMVALSSDGSTALVGGPDDNLPPSPIRPARGVWVFVTQLPPGTPKITKPTISSKDH